MSILRWDDVPDHLRNDSFDRDRRKKWPYEPAVRCEAARHRFSFPSGGEYYDRCISPAEEDGLCLYHWWEESMPEPSEPDQNESGEEFISPFGRRFTKLRATRVSIGADGVDRIIDIETAHGVNYKVLIGEDCRLYMNGEEMAWTPPI